jgi:hypothetical protein
MAWGGKRAGSGRKKTKDTPEGKLRAELAMKALKEGTTPLEVMLEAMREAYQVGGALAAMPYAKEAAPYLHPKLSSVEANIDGTLGTYAAQPIPTEERHPLESAAGPAANGDSASRN